MIVRSCLTPSELQAVYARAGIQATAQRLAIGRFVLCEAAHPTADEVKRWMDANFPKVSLATVYNTLKVLVEAGLLRELRLPHDERVRYDSHVTPHAHFLDEASGEVLDLPPDAVRLSTTLAPGWRVEATEILLRGRRG